MQIICQAQAMADSGVTTAQIMRYTGCSRSWCIALMRQFENQGIIQVREYSHRKNRSGFMYRVVDEYMTKYKDGEFRNDYNSYFDEVIAYHITRLENFEFD